MPDSVPVPAKGQVWQSTDPKRPRSIALVDVGPRRVAFHDERKQLKSLSRAALLGRFVMADVTLKKSPLGFTYAYHPDHA